MRFVGIDFDVIPSNNHASPSGALPFLIPAHPVNNNTPIPSSKLQKWAIEQVHCEEEQQLDLRFEVYASLLDHRIRNAWVSHGSGHAIDPSILTHWQLYTLYLDPEEFAAVGKPLYVDPSSTHSAVRTALAVQLQQAAQTEILKTSSYIDVGALEAEASDAFEALSTLLGDNLHFFDRPNPGLFDASVFAYTHLILDEKLGWRRNRLGQLLRKHENLVQHRERLLKFF